MKEKLLALLTASASLLATQTAFADNIFGVSWIDGWYIQGSGSVAWHNKQKFNIADVDTFHVKFDTGYGAAASVGAILCQQWRLEAEVLWRRFSVDSANSSELGNVQNADGHIQDIAIMFNAYYDIPLWCYWGAYIGTGIGVDFNEFQTSGSLTLDDEIFSAPTGKEHKTLFAWQVSGGLSYDITDCLTFFTDYRLFMTTKEKLPGNIKANERPLVHSVDFGLRWRL